MGFDDFAIETKPVERTRDTKNYSDQDRFKVNVSPQDFFVQIMNWTTDAEDNEPVYSPSSRERDKWLQELVHKEPHLSGILSSAVSIDKNRGWRLVGGRNQVLRYSNMLHNFEAAPGVYGWRPAISMSSTSFWGTDMGSVTELGREGRNGPIRKLYCVDPTECILTGNSAKPLTYYTINGKKINWRPKDYIRVMSMPSIIRKFNGLGLSAVSRCVDVAKLFIAMAAHDQEQLDARAPRGLLLLQGIREKQWLDAMGSREENLDAIGYEYYGALAVLASSGAPIDAKLIALSQLPAGFDAKVWSDMLMYTYALCFGYDASEFYPVQYGALGRGSEVEIQHEKATGKGRLEFALGFQEQLQEFLPTSLSFVFDQRDEQGDLVSASVDQAWANVAISLYEAKPAIAREGKEYESLISREEARALLARHEVIPHEWVPEVDVSSATDIESEAEAAEELETEDTAEVEVVSERNYDIKSSLDKYRAELRETASIHHAAMRFPAEPIIQYSFPDNRLIVLWERADEVYAPKVWRGM